MTKKFLEIVKRQAELAAKAAAGNATAEELAEMKKLNAAIIAATAPVEVKTTLKTMTLAAYREWHDAAMKSIEDGTADAELLAVVKRNLAAVKDQGKTKTDDIVAVEMPVEKTPADLVAALEQRVADLEAKLAAAPADKGDAGTSKQEKPTAQALAMEAVDTLLAKYTKLKGLVSGGSFSKDDLRDLYEGDWQLKDIIAQAAAVMQKADELKAAAEAVLPELKKLEGEGDDKGGDKGGDDKGGDARDDKGDDDKGDDDKGGDDKGDDDKGDGDAGDDKGEGTEKGASPWTSGGDMSPRATAAEQHKAIKGRKEKFGF